MELFSRKLVSAQTNLVVVLHALPLLFWHFTNTSAYHLGYYKPSSPSTKEISAFARYYKDWPKSKQV